MSVSPRAILGPGPSTRPNLRPSLVSEVRTRACCNRNHSEAASFDNRQNRNIISDSTASPLELKATHLILLHVPRVHILL